MPNKPRPPWDPKQPKQPKEPWKPKLPKLPRKPDTGDRATPEDIAERARKRQKPPPLRQTPGPPQTPKGQ